MVLVMYLKCIRTVSAEDAAVYAAKSLAVDKPR